MREREKIARGFFFRGDFLTVQYWHNIRQHTLHALHTHTHSLSLSLSSNYWGRVLDTMGQMRWCIGYGIYGLEMLDLEGTQKGMWTCYFIDGRCEKYVYRIRVATPNICLMGIGVSCSLFVSFNNFSTSRISR